MATGTVSAEERRDAIEAIVRKMEDAIHEAMSEARDALDSIGVPDGPLDPADREALDPFEPTLSEAMASESREPFR